MKITMTEIGAMEAGDITGRAVLRCVFFLQGSRKEHIPNVVLIIQSCRDGGTAIEDGTETDTAVETAR